MNRKVKLEEKDKKTIITNLNICTEGHGSSCEEQAGKENGDAN